MERHPITCHILDTTRGRPAENVLCQIYRIGNVSGGSQKATSETQALGKARTNKDGRVALWTLENSFPEFTSAPLPGVYKIRFETEQYFVTAANGDAEKAKSFFPFVDVHFTVPSPADAHYHIPLLLSNYSYSTYRGS